MECHQHQREPICAARSVMLLLGSRMESGDFCTQPGHCAGHRAVALIWHICVGGAAYLGSGNSRVAQQTADRTGCDGGSGERNQMKRIADEQFGGYAGDY